MRRRRHFSRISYFSPQCCVGLGTQYPESPFDCKEFNKCSDNTYSSLFFDGCFCLGETFYSGTSSNFGTSWLFIWSLKIFSLVWKGFEEKGCFEKDFGVYLIQENCRFSKSKFNAIEWKGKGICGRDPLLRKFTVDRQAVQINHKR